MKTLASVLLVFSTVVFSNSLHSAEQYTPFTLGDMLKPYGSYDIETGIIELDFSSASVGDWVVYSSEHSVIKYTITEMGAGWHGMGIKWKHELIRSRYMDDNAFVQRGERPEVLVDGPMAPTVFYTGSWLGSSRICFETLCIGGRPIRFLIIIYDEFEVSIRHYVSLDFPSPDTYSFTLVFDHFGNYLERHLLGDLGLIISDFGSRLCHK